MLNVVNVASTQKLSPVLRLREAIRHTFLYDLFIPFLRPLLIWTWEVTGKPIPPPASVKQRTVLAYRAKFNLTTLIETGTYYGDMVSAMKHAFTRIISIEMKPDLAHRAKRRFARFPHIEILQGDSGSLIKEALKRTPEPCLFWLDAHTHFGETGKDETPILMELADIMNRKVAGDVILIDDARLFFGENGYPTVPELQNFISAHRPDWVFENRHDIFRIHAG